MSTESYKSYDTQRPASFSKGWACGILRQGRSGPIGLLVAPPSTLHEGRSRSWLKFFAIQFGSSSE